MDQTRQQFFKVTSDQMSFLARGWGEARRWEDCFFEDRFTNIRITEITREQFEAYRARRSGA